MELENISIRQVVNGFVVSVMWKNAITAENAIPNAPRAEYCYEDQVYIFSTAEEAAEFVTKQLMNPK